MTRLIILYNYIKIRWGRVVAVLFFTVCMSFIVYQIIGVFIYPVKNEKDIIFLDTHGEREYIYQLTDEEEQSQLAAYYLLSLYQRGIIKNERITTVIADLENNSIGDVVSSYQNDTYLMPWINSAIYSVQYKMLSPEEANLNILEQSSGYGYQKVFQDKYITYSSAVLSFLIAAIAYYIIKTDENTKCREIYMCLLGSDSIYFRIQYLSIILPIFIAFYLVGGLLNLLSFYKFYLTGYEIDYLPFAKRFLIFFVPNVILFSAVAAFLMIVFTASAKYVPLYVLWCIMNITPSATSIGGLLKTILFFKRLDFVDIPINFRIVLEQLLIVFIGVFIFESAIIIRRWKER